MTHVFNRRALRTTLVAVLAAVGVLGLPVVQAAVADDAAAAWSVSPADGAGAPDGRTRLELQADPGASVQDHLVIANASTIERTFAVYGADAFNTGTGGYDLRPAATPAVDVGAWVTVDTPKVTIPALSSAVVAVTVAVPAGAAPGDHPGGVAVSVANPTPDAQGVILDTRVAVRLNLRVSGDLKPELTVRDAHATYGSSWMPFGSAPTTLRYDVTNSGNVKIIGKPRARITGPFGLTLAKVDAGSTQEILPGQTVTVETTTPGVAPLVLGKAVIDVDMSAAPGPDTQIPLVSTSARTSFLAISWSGLVVLLLVAAVVWYLVRRVRRRRREGEELWATMIAEARDAGTAPQLPGSPQGSPHGAGAARLPVVILALVLAGGALGLSVAQAPTALAAAPSRLGGDSSDTGSLQLVVPPAPVASTGLGSGAGTGGVKSGGTKSGTNGSGGMSGAGAAPETAAGGAEAPTAVPTPTKSAGLAPDLIWASWTARHRTPAQWALIGGGSLGLLAAAGLLARPAVLRLVRTRRGGLAA